MAKRLERPLGESSALAMTTLKCSVAIYLLAMDATRLQRRSGALSRGGHLL